MVHTYVALKRKYIKTILSWSEERNVFCGSVLEEAKKNVASVPSNQYNNGLFAGLPFSELTGLFKEKWKNMNRASTLC